MKYLFNQIGMAAIGLLFATTACNNSSTPSETGGYSANEETPVTPTPEPTPEPPPAPEAPVNTKRDTVRIKTSMGDITVVLYNETPKHHDNFMKLVNDKYYNGVLFHRVIKGFMIQTGDPDSKKAEQGAMYGMGGPNYLIPAEINPGFFHKKGALAAARTDNPEKASSGSQFYICHVATPQLDGQYTVFGETISGFDVIDKIAMTPIAPGDRPLKDIKIISMTVVKSGKPAKVDKTSSKSGKAEKEVILQTN